jgi:AcrR family transcriptional regulator
VPYPSQINREVILAAARELIEAGGMAQVSLNRLADMLGVRTPSLYRYVDSKAALLRAVNDATFQGLFGVITPLLDAPGDAPERAMAIAVAYRAYAHQHPVTYGMVYTNTISELRPDPTEQERAVLPFQALLAAICGEVDSLPALRGLLALMHGFVMLELAGQLQRGGDLDAAYTQSVRAYLAGWASHQ